MSVSFGYCFLVFVKKSRDLTWVELKSFTRIVQAKKRKKSPFVWRVPELDFEQSFSTIRHGSTNAPSE
jgi:hypothetical protein